MIIENIFLLAFIAALFNTDMTGFGQFMLCRPIFCAPIFGYLTGDIGTGLWIGMIVEMIWINAVPLGSALPMDICSISILSVFWTNVYFPGLSSSGSAALVFALPFGFLCRYIDAFGRQLNTKIMHWVEEGIKDNKYSRVKDGIAAGLFLFIFKFFVFYIIAMPVGGKIYNLIYLQMPSFALNGLARAWFLLPVLGFGAVIYNFWGMNMQGFRK
ncbi:MAG: PTS sugar transporter subunit IIC [Elusimicrobiota bacterium]|nr:PTS sugar transporter subunit IIC [Elusimicrobiota bacterium]